MVDRDPASFQRYTNWIHDYFPEPIYEISEVRDYIRNASPHLREKSINVLASDWENFIAPQVERDLERVLEPIGEKTPSFWVRIKRFLGRWFGRWGR